MMKSIKIAGKTFKLASRMKRLYALFIDTVLLGTGQLGLGSLLFLLGLGSTLLFGLLSAILWSFGLLFIDGFRNGQGIGKKLLSLQVLRLKDGKPCTFKDAFVRRLSGIFQPLDFFWSLGKKRQRLGDKFAETVVVEFEPELEQTEAETEDPEQVLEAAVAEMKSKLSEAHRKPELEQTEAETEDPEQVLEAAVAEMKSKLSEAQQKVDASIGVEKQFQDAYEGAVTQVERWQERAVINLNAGREDLAREDLEKRNEYRQLADKYKTQWEEQKQVVQTLSDLLEHLQQKVIEAEERKTTIVAQHRNIDAEAHLREILKEIQDSKAFETLTKMEQDATEAATLAKAAAEMDVAYQDTRSEREFTSYAKEASIDKDLAELKTKLQ